MFEKYTEKARRVIFFARYESSQFGSPYIETEHLLLGLLREDKALTYRFFHEPTPVENIRKQIEANTVIREKVSTSVDLPLSDENKRDLAYAAEEADRLSHKHIGTEHLLLGLLREETSFAARILNEHGVRLSAVREELANVTQDAEIIQPKKFALLSEYSQYLTRMAREQRLLPLIGREKEFEQMVHILGRSGKSNVVLTNHEFEKARFYSDEERNQREALRQLQQKHSIPDTHAVTREHIEEALARWTGMPVAAIRQAASGPETVTRKQVARKRARKTKKKSS